MKPSNISTVLQLEANKIISLKFWRKRIKMEYCSALKRKEALAHDTIRINLEGIMLSK